MAKKRGGGPNTEEGKRNSSLNATKHGCRAKTRILADEKQEDFDEVERGWIEEFGPETYMEKRLVAILVDNDWLLQRVVRRLHEAEAEGGNVELMHRYKTSAERSFYRSLNALQQLRKDLMRQERDTEWWKDRAHKLEKELEKRPPAPVKEPKPKLEEPKAKTKETLTKAAAIRSAEASKRDCEACSRCRAVLEAGGSG